MVLPGWSGCLSHRLQQRLRPAIGAGQTVLSLRHRGFAAGRSRVERRESLLRPVALRLCMEAGTGERTSVNLLGTEPSAPLLVAPANAGAQRLRLESH